MSYAFTRNEIHRVAPTSGGVYRIFNDRSNIYVGESENLDERLKQHYDRQSDQSSCIWRYGPVYFDFERIWGGKPERLRKENEWKRIYGSLC